MPLKEILAFLFLLVVVFLFANLWFHFVEVIISRIKKVLTIHKEPPTWHSYPCEEEEVKPDNNKKG